MDCSNESLRVDMGVIVGVSGNTKNCDNCVNLEEKKIKAIECNCSDLRQGIEQERNELEGKFEVLKRRNQELEEQIRRIESNGSNEEEERVLQLMIENSVLECEKKKAESDVEYWKSKCNELQLTVAELGKKLDAKAGDTVSTRVHGLQDECDDLTQKIHLQVVDEMQNKDGEIGSLLSQDSVMKEKKNRATEEEEENSRRRTEKIARGRGVEEQQKRGKSLAKTPILQAKFVRENKALLSESGNNCVNKVRKRLTFEEERGSNKWMAPSTPASESRAKVIVIDITESDDERTTGPPYTSIMGSDFESSVPLGTPPVPGIVCTVPFCGSGSNLSNSELPSKNDSKMTVIEQVEDSDIVCHDEEPLYVPTPKRRRASNIIASDSDTDDDDDKVPICMLKTRHFCEKSSNDHPRGHSTQTGDSDDEVRNLSSKRRLVKLSQCEGKGGGGNDIGEEVSNSEGESLGGFIVSSSDISDDDDTSNSVGALQSYSAVAKDSITDSEYVSESDSDYGEIISRIRRNKGDKLEWEFEGDMLAAFGKDPELCMKAVCVLYRQQTSEEQCCKGTIDHNQRGFSHCDAFRGSTLAEFLTYGDPKGDMTKSVKELQAYDPKGIELCRTLATRYSKQLFSIYKNEEDPFFSAP